MSLRETLQTVERMTGRTPPELANPVEFPDVLYDLWQHYMRLRDSRPVGLAVSAIPETEIRAYCLNRSVRFSGYELRVLRALDNTERDQAKERKGNGS